MTDYMSVGYPTTYYGQYHEHKDLTASNLAGILASTLSSVIEKCDQHYLRLEYILTQGWT